MVSRSGFDMTHSRILGCSEYATSMSLPLRVTVPGDRTLHRPNFVRNRVEIGEKSNGRDDSRIWSSRGSCHRSWLCCTRYTSQTTPNPRTVVHNTFISVENKGDVQPHRTWPYMVLRYMDVLQVHYCACGINKQNTCTWCAFHKCW